jgi:DNA-binding transcriptional LysR family regulator
MKLRQIEVVYAVLQSGSLSAAARLLNITQPSATKHLQQAEAGLGYALFRRANGRLHPTEELLQLAPSLRAAYAGFDDVRRTALSLRRQPQARLRIGCVLSMAGPLPQAYEALRKRHPDLRCEFSTGHHDTLLQWLLMREIDVGIVLEPRPHPAIAYQDLGMRRLVCAGLPQLLGKYRHAAKAEAEALCTMPLIEVLATDPVGSLVSTYAERYGWPFPARLAVKTHQVALDLAARGLGVAVVDDLSAMRYQPALKVLPIEPAAAISVQAMFLQPGSLSQAADNFIAAYRSASQPAPAQ